MAHPAVEGFRRAWPTAFAGPMLDKLSGNAIRWPTTQNRRSRGEIPRECFIEGRPTIVLRDPFLDWWETFLLGRTPAASSPGPRRSRRQAEAEKLAAEIGDPVVSDEVSDKAPAPRIRRRRSAKTSPPRTAEAAPAR
jgi:hypothetical protein